jgi:hypothetical protein
VLDANNRQTKIRLHQIDGPEKKQDYGQRSKQYLSDLAYGKQARGEVADIDRYRPNSLHSLDRRPEHQPGHDLLKSRSHRFEMGGHYALKYATKRCAVRRCRFSNFDSISSH